MAFLDGDLSSTRARKELPQPIYLFVRSVPPNLPDGYTSSLYYWSLQERGQNPLSPEICDELGLPNELEFTDDYYSFFCPAKIYKRVFEYQRLQGFDPTTNDFAQHVDFGNTFQLVNDAAHFKEVTEGVLKRSFFPPLSDMEHRAGLSLLSILRLPWGPRQTRLRHWKQRLRRSSNDRRPASPVK